MKISGRKKFSPSGLQENGKKITLILPLFQYSQRLPQHIGQSVHFVVHLNTQRLKSLCQYLLFFVLKNKRLENADKVIHRFYFSLSRNFTTDAAIFAAFFSSPYEEKTRVSSSWEYSFSTSDAFSLPNDSSAYPTDLKTKRKSSFRIVKMMRRHPKSARMPSTRSSL